MRDVSQLEPTLTFMTEAAWKEEEDAVEDAMVTVPSFSQPEMRHFTAYRCWIAVNNRYFRQRECVGEQKDWSIT